MEAGGCVATVTAAIATAPAPAPAAPVHQQDSAGRHDVPDGDVLPRPLCCGEEEDGSLHPPDRPDLEDAAMQASSADVPEPESLHSCVSTASMKVKSIKKLSFPKGHFPRLAECAHFHYENVDFGSIQLSLSVEQCEAPSAGGDPKDLLFLVQICCQGHSWLLRRSYEDFRVLDKHLHLCIYDRRFSQLTELPRYEHLKDKTESLPQMLTAYLTRLSAIADNKINCGPALTWMEIDNKGNHLLVRDESSINVPAIAAAHVIKRYIAQAADELSFEVGDIVSVIDMPPKEDTGWWRGKHGFQVGFFPCDCVELISEKLPASVATVMSKPVSKKHGKLITFLRSFMKSRPSKQKLKQRGIFRERVFGCDLGEHLLNSGHDVPQVIRSCTEFIEKHGVVDGIYRLSGIASNIQKLRHDFDSEHVPDLTKDIYVQDIHSVGSLCKLYFRELPNPLLTYQLYEKFSDAVSAATDEERLVKIHDVIQQLPPPHYRTLEFLMRHLARLAAFSYITNMHSKNLAIVWAPNLLRSRQIESACFSGTSAFMEVRIQSVVVEFILNHVEVLFSPKLNSLIREGSGHGTLARPKSLLVCSPSTKLLSLEEAQARISPSSPHSRYIEVGEGPSALQGKFHTVIDFPAERPEHTHTKKAPVKSKKSPVGGWRNFFHLGRSSSTAAKRKLHRHPSEPNQIKTMALPGGRGDSGTLRSAKSEESLSSHNFEAGDHELPAPRRPLSVSEALSTSLNEELLESQAHATPKSASTTSCVPALISPPHHDTDLRPLASGLGCLDFDPAAFQSSGPPAHPARSESRKPGSKRGRSYSNGANDAHQSVISASDKATAVVSLHSPENSPPQLPLEEEEEEEEEEEAGLNSLSSAAAPPEEDRTGVAGPRVGPEPRAAGVAPVAAPDSVSSTPLTSSPSMRSEALPSEAGSSIAGSKRSDAGPSRAGSKRSGSCSADCRAAAMEPKQNRPDPGSLTLDCTPGLVSAESLISPQPSGKSAARMLALALAESAQQVALHTQRVGPSQQPQSPSSPTPKLPLLSPVNQPHDWPPRLPPTATVPSADPNDPPPSRTAHSAGGAGMADSAPPRVPSGPTPVEERLSASAVKPPRVCSACGGQQREQGLKGPLPAPRLCQCSVPPAHQRPPMGVASTGTTTSLAQEPPEGLRSHPSAEEQGRGGSPKNLHLQLHLHHHDPHHPPPKPVPPTPPRRTAESRLATAALQNREAVNASNFRTVLAEASAPASVKEVFPPHPPLLSPGSSSYLPLGHEEESYAHTRHARPRRGAPPPFPSQPESLPPHLGGLKARPKSTYDNHYGTLGPRSLHQSIKYREPYRDEHPSATHLRRSGQWYAPLEGALVYPTIRRVRSLHAPPEDRPFFFQNNPYPRKGHAEIHQVQPYFENGKVQYRYNPYSDTPHGDLDAHRPPRQYGHAHGQSYTVRRVPPPPLKMGCAAASTPHSGCYPNPLSHVMPEKDYSFLSHKGCYLPRMDESSLPHGWNSELPDRHFQHSTLRRDSRAKRKPQGPAPGQQYVPTSPSRAKPEPSRGERRHVRHRSDSGRDLLISTEEPGGHFKVTMVSQSSPEQLFSSEGESSQPEQLRKADLGAREALFLKQNCAPYRNFQQLQESRPLPPHLSLHKEYSCPDFKHSDSGGGGSGGRAREPERALYRTLSSRYPEEEFYYPRVGARGAPRPERSQSIKGQLPPPDRAKMEPLDPWGAPYPQPKVRSHSFVASRYDTMEGYVPGAQARTPKLGPFPNHGCMPPSTHRLYSTALGQGGFLQGQPRPEAEVYVE